MCNLFLGQGPLLPGLDGEDQSNLRSGLLKVQSHYEPGSLNGCVKQPVSDLQPLARVLK